MILVNKFEFAQNHLNKAKELAPNDQLIVSGNKLIGKIYFSAVNIFGFYFTEKWYSKLKFLMSKIAGKI